MDNRYHNERRYSSMSTRNSENLYNGNRFGSSRLLSNGGEKRELASKRLFIDSKKYYIDLIQSHHGKLIKFTEVSVKGLKFKLVMRIEAAADILAHLSDFSEFVSRLNTKKLESWTGNNPVKTARLFNENRKYFLDLINFPSGLFLKIVAKSASREKNQVLIPASGLEAFTAAVKELLKESGHFFGKKPGISNDLERKGGKRADVRADRIDSSKYSVACSCGEVGCSCGEGGCSNRNNNNNNNNNNNDNNNEILNGDGCVFTFDNQVNPYYLTITQQQDDSTENMRMRIPVGMCKRFALAVLANLSEEEL